MATWKSLIEKHTDIIDTTATSGLDTLDIMLADATNTCIDAVPQDILYKYAQEPLSVTAAGVDVSNRKIIMVQLRGKPCHQREFYQKTDFEDSSSIKYATKKTPVYYIKNLGDPNTGGDQSTSTLFVFPDSNLEIGDGLVWTFPYLTTLSATSDVTTGGDLGIPPQLYDWIIIETALRVLNWKMAQMIYVEEDAELTAMVTGQINNLSRISEERKVRFVIKNPVDRRIQGGAD